MYPSAEAHNFCGVIGLGEGTKSTAAFTLPLNPDLIHLGLNPDCDLLKSGSGLAALNFMLEANPAHIRVVV